MREERIAKLQEFLAKNPNDSFSRYALALEFAGQGETERAIALLEKLLRDYAIAVFKRGMEVAVAQGDLHARGEMQEALDELQV